MGINNLGEICGYFTYGGLYSQHGFLAKPIACQADLGFGGPGTARLAVCGEPLRTGNRATLRLQSAPANATGALLIAARSNPTFLPALGGTLATFPAFSFVPITTDEAGEFKWTGIPGGGGPASLVVQALLVDSSQARGAAISNAVQITFAP